LDFWRKGKQEVLEGDEGTTGGGKSRSRSSTAVAVRPLPEDALAIIPLRNSVLFPGVITPITIGRAGSIAAAQEAARNELKVGFVLQRDPQINQVGPTDLYRVGTAGQIVRVAGNIGVAVEGAQHLMVQGERRFRIVQFLEGWPFLVASVAWIPEIPSGSPDVEARFMQL
jgi:ATP-dependent Lon protease